MPFPIAIPVVAGGISAAEAALALAVGAGAAYAAQQAVKNAAQQSAQSGYPTLPTNPQTPTSPSPSNPTSPANPFSPNPINPANPNNPSNPVNPNNPSSPVPIQPAQPSNPNPLNPANPNNPVSPKPLPISPQPLPANPIKPNPVPQPLPYNPPAPPANPLGSPYLPNQPYGTPNPNYRYAIYYRLFYNNSSGGYYGSLSVAYAFGSWTASYAGSGAGGYQDWVIDDYYGRGTPANNIYVVNGDRVDIDHVDLFDYSTYTGTPNVMPSTTGGSGSGGSNPPARNPTPTGAPTKPALPVPFSPPLPFSPTPTATPLPLAPITPIPVTPVAPNPTTPAIPTTSPAQPIPTNTSPTQNPTSPVGQPQTGTPPNIIQPSVTQPQYTQPNITNSGTSSGSGGIPSFVNPNTGQVVQPAAGTGTTGNIGTPITVNPATGQVLSGGGMLAPSNVPAVPIPSQPVGGATAIPIPSIPVTAIPDGASTKPTTGTASPTVPTTGTGTGAIPTSTLNQPITTADAIKLIPLAIASSLPVGAMVKTAAAEATCETMQPNACGGKALQAGLDDKFGQTVKDNAGNVLGFGAVLTAISGVATQITALAAQVLAIGTNVINVWNAVIGNRLMGALNLITNIHNAAMLSRDLGTTLVGAMDNVVTLFGIKNPDGSAVSLSSVIGNGVADMIKSIIGADNYASLVRNWAYANRIYQSGMNIASTVQNMFNSANQVATLTGVNVSHIGNSLREQGIVAENSYPHMPETPNDINAKRFGELTALKNTLQGASEIASQAQNITGSLVSVQQDWQTLKTTRDEMNEAIDGLRSDDMGLTDEAKTLANLLYAEVDINPSDFEI